MKTHRYLPLVPCLGFLVASPAPTDAAGSEPYCRNWPQWRGPAGNGLVLNGNPPLEWSEATNVRWKVELITPYVPSPLLYDGLLFFCQRTSALVSCLDAATGKPHYQLERLEPITGVYASPIGVRNRIYLAGQNGVTMVLERAKELKILATNKLDDGFDASPAVVGNELFLRGRKNLYCLAAQ